MRETYLLRDNYLDLKQTFLYSTIKSNFISAIKQLLSLKRFNRNKAII